MSITRMQQKRGTAAEWAANNPVLADGEIGFERDTGVLKVGNGVDPWNQLVPILKSVLSPTAAEWAAQNPVLGQGVVGIERDTLIMKIGDGVTAWNSLPATPESEFETKEHAEDTFLPKANAPVNAKTFGVVGDGVADDQAALVAFLAASVGKRAVLPPGVYAHSGVLTIGDVRYLEADGATLLASTASAALHLDNASGSGRTDIRGLSVDCGNRRRYGLIIARGSKAKLIRPSVKNVLEVGTDPGQAAGLFIRGETSLTIIDVDIDNVSAPTSGVARGILIAQSPALEAEPERIRIQGGLISDISPVADGDGIVVQNWTGKANVVIRDVDYVNCAKRAIKFQSPGCAVKGGTVRLADGTMGYSIASIYASDCSVEGLEVFGGQWNYLFEVGAVGYTCEYVTFRDNTVKVSSAVSASGVDYVRVFGTVNHLRVQGNSIRGAGRHGIYLTCSGAHILIRDNDFVDLSGSFVTFGATGSLSDVSVHENHGVVSNWLLGGVSTNVTKVSAGSNQGSYPFGIYNATEFQTIAHTVGNRGAGSTDNSQGSRLQTHARVPVLNVNSCEIHTHSTNPEGVVTAPAGSLCMVTSGALYKKSTGSGNTGWVLVS